jgi:decaprenyl-phosphate phosphoribosyltransferase
VKALSAYLEIARLDHWIKNVFVLPGLLVALSIDPGRLRQLDPWTVLAGLLAVCLVSSANYVLNEILDAPSDRFHPYKLIRPVPSGRVSVRAAYAEWLLLFAAGLALGWRVSPAFTATLVALWAAGCAYNVPPLRTKDVPYLDVLSEAVNNPLRMLAGWYLTGTSAVPITSLLISYWMVGCYVMGIKRYAEYRELAPAPLAAYRKSFASYSERSLLVSILFYGSHAMLFFGAFIARYRLELILAFPFVAVVMAVYFWLAFQKNSPVQHPETLYREPLLLVPVALCAILMTSLLFIDVPALKTIFAPTQGGL